MLKRIKQGVVLTSLKNFVKHECSYYASSLTLVSLLALVPILALFLGLLALIPDFNQVTHSVQHFIFNHFVPESGQLVEDYIGKFVSKARDFSMVGGGGVLISSLLLIYNIEASLNKIWEIRRSRKFLNACLLYISILIILPLFLGLSIIISSYLSSLSFFGHGHFIEKNTLLLYAPFFLAWAGFTGLYYIIPNRRVKLGQAVFSALLATLLFQVLKTGFSFYLKHVVFYELVYGVFATLPIFMIWLYLVWMLTLFCAEINHTLAKKW